jgi:hypothetical protein
VAGIDAVLANSWLCRGIHHATEQSIVAIEHLDEHVERRPMPFVRHKVANEILHSLTFPLSADPNSRHWNSAADINSAKWN